MYTCVCFSREALAQSIFHFLLLMLAYQELWLFDSKTRSGGRSRHNEFFEGAVAELRGFDRYKLHYEYK